jgi:hypothetical protein
MPDVRTGLRRIRRPSARALLAVFVLAGQLAPIAHLATHRNDHTHGPEFAAFGTSTHEAAHRAGLAHTHVATGGDELTAEERAWLNGDDGPAPPAHSDDTPSHDHGRGSVSHFSVAVTEGPPPPLVPPPGEAMAQPPDTALDGHDAPALSHPPSRGPPA